MLLYPIKKCCCRIRLIKNLKLTFQDYNSCNVFLDFPTLSWLVNYHSLERPGIFISQKLFLRFIFWSILVFISIKIFRDISVRRPHTINPSRLKTWNFWSSIFKFIFVYWVGSTFNTDTTVIDFSRYS